MAFKSTLTTLGLQNQLFRSNQILRSIPTNTLRSTSVLSSKSSSKFQLQSTRSLTTNQASTTPLSQDENLNLLNKQRSVRPSSPHFTIYQPQLTWYGSIANRITGVGLSGLLYVYAITYLAAPYVGIQDIVSSAGLADTIAMAPFWLKTTLKAPLALAASFHSFNGLRHLAWDWGFFLSLKGAYASGYAVIGASLLSTVGLCLL